MTVNVESVHALAPVQEGILFHVLYSPDANLYRAQLHFLITGPLDVPRWRSAWQQVIARHSVLRTSFEWEATNEPRQIVHRDASPVWTCGDWRCDSTRSQDAKLKAYLRSDWRRPFDLSRAPLIRCGLFASDAISHHFILSTHHLILDGWSQSIVLREVIATYRAIGRGEAAELPPAIPFHDHVEWLERQDYASARQFWTSRLAGVRPANPHPHETQRRAGHVHLVKPAAWTNALRTAARRSRLTLSTVATGACLLALARQRRQSEVVLGGVVSGRSGVPEADTRVGVFLNTLPIRVRLDLAAPAHQWLLDLQRDQAIARDFEYVSLATIQQWTGHAGRSALFDTALAFENYPSGSFDGGEVGIRRMGSSDGANYPLSVLMSVRENETHLKAIYSSASYEKAAVEPWLHGVAFLMEAVMQTGQRPLGEIRSWPHGEPAAAVGGRRDRSALLEGFVSIDQSIQAQARKDPAKVAVDMAGERLSYGELDDRANDLASVLRRHGVRPETRVAVCLGHGAGLVIAALAVWKAGGVYVPIDPAYPDERIAFMIEDCKPTVGVTARRRESRSTGMAALPWIDVADVSRDAEPAGPPPGIIHPRQLAYIIYTSGSTGRPKGVAIDHRGLANMAAAQKMLGIESGDRLLQLSSPGFDASIFDLCLALTSGATLVPLPDRAQLVDAITTTHVTALTVPPSVLAAIPQEWLGQIRTMFVAGEACPLALAARAASGRRLWNLYGPTEATIWATAAALDPDPKSVPMGDPVPHTQVWLLDVNLVPVPSGAVGELYLSGVGLARCYINQPALTAETFLPNPFNAFGERLYRTGDCARRDESGALEFVGRSDHQIKLRGYRIELGEIEAVLREHDRVDDAVVVARGDGEAKQIVAYVVGRSTIDDRVMRGWLSERLPAHMVPIAIVQLERWPLSASGKVDRSALPEPGRAPAVRSAVAGGTDTERQVAEVWKRILGTAIVDPNENFFESGGNSLLAIRVFTMLKNTFDKKINLVDVFRYPTVRSFARFVDGGVASQPASTRDDESSQRQRAIRQARLSGQAS